MTRANTPARHERLDDLLAASDDPHPRKTRRIEWIGDKSPLDDPVVAFNLLMGKYTPTQEKAIRRAAAKVHSRVWGDRLLEHEHQHAQAVVKGMRRSYIFTKKHKFICEMDYKDVDILFSSPIAREFVDLTDRDDDEPIVLSTPLDPLEALLGPADTFYAAASTEFVGVGPQRGDLVASH